MSVSEQLFEIIKEKSFKYSETAEFKLASGQMSNYYFDCKMTLLDPAGLRLIGKAVYEKIKDVDADGIGGLTLGADPIAISTSLAALEDGRILYPLIVRKEPKGHGTQKYIEGHVSKVKKAIVLDDVITTGASTIKAIERMRAEGIDIKIACVIIDREENDGKTNILNMGVDVIPLFKKTDFK